MPLIPVLPGDKILEELRAGFAEAQAAHPYLNAKQHYISQRKTVEAQFAEEHYWDGLTSTPPRLQDELTKPQKIGPELLGLVKRIRIEMMRKVTLDEVLRITREHLLLTAIDENAASANLTPDSLIDCLIYSACRPRSTTRCPPLALPPARDLDRHPDWQQRDGHDPGDGRVGLRADLSRAPQTRRVSVAVASGIGSTPAQARDALISHSRVVVIVTTPTSLKDYRGTEAIRAALVSAEKGRDEKWVPCLPLLFASGSSPRALRSSPRGFDSRRTPIFLGVCLVHHSTGLGCTLDAPWMFTFFCPCLAILTGTLAGGAAYQLGNIDQPFFGFTSLGPRQSDPTTNAEFMWPFERLYQGIVMAKDWGDHRVMLKEVANHKIGEHPIAQRPRPSRGRTRSWAAGLNHAAAAAAASTTLDAHGGADDTASIMSTHTHRSHFHRSPSFHPHGVSPPDGGGDDTASVISAFSTQSHSSSGRSTATHRHRSPNPVVRAAPLRAFLELYRSPGQGFNRSPSPPLLDEDEVEEEEEVDDALDAQEEEDVRARALEMFGPRTISWGDR
ncbi:hypothetical protein PAPYR_9691 [Paratrimastix pyriformis]|uniref:Uncharacterized protein n=1 Tax=Paratrimastix pyriformis TaxID=342808 RepID=A0ABQ8UBY2_9EUKA|nr:hypothetical protein PAPYR_9691 [Paratrimastix pyriformis]